MAKKAAAKTAKKVDASYAIAAPNALAIVFNYMDRMVSPDGTKSPQGLERLVMTTASLRSIKTQKSKSSPAGEFELTLAPNYNWLSVITAGSWVVILMTRDIAMSSLDGTTAANPKTLKMIGRIESVRTAAGVNQETGARETQFVVSGRDWGSIFESTVYIDTLFGTAMSENPATGNALTDRFKTVLADTKDGSSPFYSTSQIMQDIMKIYGTAVVQTILTKSNITNAVIQPDQVFHVPQALANYCGWKAMGRPSTSMADLVRMKTGRLVKYDEYKEVSESCGWLNPFSVLGQHTYWQILTEHSNTVLNEMISEIRWDNNTPNMTLYKRIRPFTVAAENLSGLIDQQNKNRAKDQSNPKGEALNILNRIYSLYKYVRRTEIPLVDIIAVDAGTNWRDKMNFIEILYDESTFKQSTDVMNSVIKPNSQIWDKKAPTREGLKPLLMTTKFFPPFSLNANDPDFGKIAPLHVMHWKYLLADWYFNTHNMLNGAIVFVGQNNYIGVGENILFPARAIMPNFNMLLDAKKYGSVPISDAYVLAHVEGISHQFGVGEDGARSFTTTVQYVRGIFTNASGEPLTSVPTVTDQTSKYSDSKRKKRSTTITTSTAMDPDKKGLFKGN